MKNLDVVWRVITGHESGVAFSSLIVGWKEYSAVYLLFLFRFLFSQLFLCGEEENQLLFTEINKLIYPTCP